MSKIIQLVSNNGFLFALADDGRIFQEKLFWQGEGSIPQKIIEWVEYKQPKLD